MKILVTGGAGFIGSHIVDRYVAEGHAVVVVDNLVTGKRENLNPKAKFYEIDIRSDKIKEIFVTEKPEVLNHHAAQIDIRKSVADPAFDAEVNIVGTLNLLQNAVKYGVRKVIFASSGGAVYGEPQYLPLDEGHLLRPLSPYAISKLAAEYYLFSYSENLGLKYTVLRYGNVYGPRQDPLGEAGVITIFIGKMLKGETPIIYGDGEQLRDYIYVEDVAEVNVRALSAGNDQIYNVGTGRGASVNELFKEIRALIGFKSEAEFGPPRKGELYKVYLNISKIENELGWKANVSLEAGLGKTVEYFRP